MTIDELMEIIREFPPLEPLDPIMLTERQWEQVRAECVQGDASRMMAYEVAPVIIVESVVDSTPWKLGWLTCTMCGRPTNDHNDWGLTCEFFVRQCEETLRRIEAEKAASGEGDENGG